jgi:hypothetical protein
MKAVVALAILALMGLASVRANVNDAGEAEGAVDTASADSTFGVDTEGEADAAGSDGEALRRPRMMRSNADGTGFVRPIIVPRGDPRAGRAAFSTAQMPKNAMEQWRTAQRAQKQAAAATAAQYQPAVQPAFPSSAPATPTPYPVTPAPNGAPAVSPASSPLSRLVRKFGENAVNNRCTHMGGACQMTNTCGGVVTRLLCPGPNSITCCTLKTSKICASIGGNCRDASTCLGTSQKGLCPGPNNIQCCVPAPSSPGMLPNVPIAEATNCLQSFDPKVFVLKAGDFVAQWRATGVQHNSARRQFGFEGVKWADQASFVVSVLDSLGWGCVFATDKSLPSMIENMRIRGAFHEVPRAGDLAVWPSSIAIVDNVCDNATKASIAVFTIDQGAQSSGCIPLFELRRWPVTHDEFFGFWSPN